jgi:ribonuclease BN (tRNA processing enzyme)
MRVTVVGCAGSFPNAASAASCYLLEAEGFRLVIDMGNGALGSLQRYVSLSDVDAVFLSHLHADHCVDLHSYRVVREWAPDGPLPPIPVYGPAGTADRIALLRGADGDDNLGAWLTFHEYPSGQWEAGPFRVTTAHMDHPVETFGFRVEHGDWTAVYSADTGESDALVGLATNADLLLCEAAFLDNPGNPPHVHLSGRQAGEHAAKAGVGELVLTHLVAWYDTDDSLTEAATTFGGPLSAAAPGRVFGPDGAGHLPALSECRQRQHRVHMSAQVIGR